MNILGRTLLSVLTVGFALLICVNAAAQDKKSFTVVIDPGHGGKSPGAVSGKLLEKDINLDIALALGKLIEKEMSDVKVIYTRKDDRDVALAERGAIANRANADLFLSIHINATTNSSANGTSTWVMGVEKNGANLAEAMRENEVVRYEDDYHETYEGFDPDSPESYIMLRLLQSAHFDRSIQFARIVQKHYAEKTLMRDRGAEQGPFLVLWKAAMPAVLTEIGFISNEADRKYISSATGKEKIARALFDAFSEYKILVEDDKAAITPPAVTPGTTTVTPTDTGKTAPEKITPAPTTPVEIAPTPATRYYVQIMATRTKHKLNDAAFGIFSGRVTERSAGGWYRYSLGPYTTSDDAATGRDYARKNGFKEAFITTIIE